MARTYCASDIFDPMCKRELKITSRERCGPAGSAAHTDKPLGFAKGFAKDSLGRRRPRRVRLLWLPSKHKMRGHREYFKLSKVNCLLLCIITN